MSKSSHKYILNKYNLKIFFKYKEIKEPQEKNSGPDSPGFIKYRK